MYPASPPGAPGRLDPRRLSTSTRLALFYAALFTVPGIHLPFWPVWLKAQGLEAEAIGLVLAAGVWVRILANPLVGHIADARGERKRLMIGLALASIAAFAFYPLAGGLAALLVVTAIFGLAWTPIISLGENLALIVAYERHLDYGRIRLWGSIAFMVASTAGGLVIEGRPAGLIFWLVLAGLVATALACLPLPEIRRPDPEPAAAPAAATPRAPVRVLLGQPLFVLFVASAGIAQASHSVLYAFGTLHWRAAGLSDDVIGLLWAEGVVAEIILFAVGTTLTRRLGPVNLLLAGAAAGIVRWSATAFTGELAALVALQALHAFTFGAAHLGAMHFLAQNVATRLSASAQSLLATFSGGVALGLGMMAAGPLYGALGGRAFLAMALLSAIGAAGTVALALLWRGQRIG
jgi:PPP family 3-phenylpropionic acid transporter